MPILFGLAFLLLRHLARSREIRVRWGRFLTLGAVIGAFAFFAMRHTSQREVDQHSRVMLHLVNSYAVALELGGLSSLDLDTDGNDPRYLELIELQKKWELSTDAVADVYTFRLGSDGKVRLLVDAETDYNHDGIFSGETEARTAIGEVYDEASAKLLGTFESAMPQFDLEPVEDRWGVFVSAYTPIRSLGAESSLSSKAGSAVTDVVGVDVPARILLMDVLEARALVLVILVFSFGMLVLFMVWIDGERAALKKLQRAQSQMVSSARLASVGQMAGAIAHEVNNPLMVIHGRSELILNQVSRSDASVMDVDKLKNSAEIIVKTSMRIGKIVNSLKLLSRGEGVKNEDLVSLGDLMDEIHAVNFERMQRAGVRLLINIEDADVRFYANHTSLLQVLVNLVNNSFDAVSGVADRWIQIDAVISQGDVLVSVTDSGPGIPLSDRTHLMEPFYTTKPAGSGTGLGLSVSLKLAEAMGGTLRLDESSAMTKFTIQIPKVTPGQV